MPIQNLDNGVDISIVKRLSEDFESGDGESLQTLVGSIYSSDDVITKYNGEDDITNKFPSLSYFSEEKDQYQDKKALEFTVRVRDNDQDRVSRIRRRIIDLLTEPFSTRSRFQRIVPDNARIGSIRLLNEEDGVDTNTKVYFVTLVFSVSYVTIR